MKKTIITTLFALVALVGQAQVSPDTITVCFKLSSKTKGEEYEFAREVLANIINDNKIK